MRTTVTLDDDVAAQLEQLRADRQQSFRRLVNEALRRGLTNLEQADRPRHPPPTKSVRLGGALLPDVDDISATLALTEGDARR